MAPPVEQVTGIQPLDDNVSNKAIESEAGRVHRAMNSGLRPLYEHLSMDTYMHEAFIMLASYAFEQCGEIYDDLQDNLIAIWTRGRQVLVKALAQAPDSPLVASTYLDKAGRDIDSGHRFMNNCRGFDCIEAEYHIESSMAIHMLIAWDESVRQNSTHYFDLLFADAIATWKKSARREASLWHLIPSREHLRPKHRWKKAAMHWGPACEHPMFRCIIPVEQKSIARVNVTKMT